MSYFSNAIILQRDASQQALTGLKIKGSDWQQCQPGDLLFFGNSATGRVTHVGIYLHFGKGTAARAGGHPLSCITEGRRTL